MRLGEKSNGLTTRGSLSILDGGVMTLGANAALTVTTTSDLRVSGVNSRIEGAAGSSLSLEGSPAGGTAVFENGGVVSVGRAQFSNTSDLTIRSGARLDVAGDSTNFNETARVLVTGAGSSLTTGGNFNFLANGLGTDVVFDDHAIVTSTGNVASSLAFMGTRRLIVSDGAQFNLTGGTAASFTLNGGILEVTDASVSLSGDLIFNGISSAIFRNSDFSANNVALLGANSRLTVGAAAGQAAANIGRINLGSQITITQPSAALVLNYTGPGLDIASQFSGTGGKFAHLAGETRLTGFSNQWRGITDLSGGSLAVDSLFGDSSGETTAMNVSGGAILSGRGTIGGVVTVGDGVIRPGGDSLASPEVALQAARLSAAAAVLGGDAIGTLTFTASLDLGAASRLQYQLGAPTGAEGVDSDLINVGGNLTLDGTLDVTDVGGFGAGLYRLINYGGTLTDNGLSVGTTPDGFVPSDLTVQTATAQQVNLLVGTPAAPGPFNFWDGSNTAANNAVDGGSGAWTTTGTNWTVTNGSSNGVFDPNALLIFAGSPGLVTVNDSAGAVVQSGGIQFAVDGYRVSGGPLGIAAGVVRVGDGTAAGAGYLATIDSVLTGNQLFKTDLGTLVLTGANTYNGGTVVAGGTVSGNTVSLRNGLVVQTGSTIAFDQAVNGTFSGSLTGNGTFRKTGAGVLTFAGTTRALDAAYSGATLVEAGTLNVTGSITGQIDVSGGATLGGNGQLGGVVTVRDGSIAPGDSGSVGTLIVGALALSPDSILNFQLGAPGGAPGVGSDLITMFGGTNVNIGVATPPRGLTLDGTLNVTDAGGFGAGLYRLIDYGGTLIDNGLTIGAVPTGFAAADLSIQTTTADQVNLLVGVTPGMFNFWDGANTAANGIVEGGTGTWTVDGRNWTGAAGSQNGTYDPTQVLIFAGTGGTVTVDGGPGQVIVRDTNQFAPLGLQFASAGYTVTGDPIAFDGIATIRVGDGTAAGAAINATIASDMIGAGRLDKTDFGTLTLTGSNTFAARSRVQGGTLEIAAGGSFNTTGLEVALIGPAALRVTGAGSLVDVGTGIRTGLVNNFAGTIEVLNGGTLRDSAFGGHNFGAGSLVRISGAGSLLDLDQGSISQGTLLVENSGLANVAPFAFSDTGSLIVRSGGRVETAQGDGVWVVKDGLIQGAESSFSSVRALGIAPGTSSNPGARFIVEDGASVTVNTNTNSGLGFEGPISTLDVRSGASFTLTGGADAGLSIESSLLTVDNATFNIGGVLLGGQRFGNNTVILRNADFSARQVELRAATDRMVIGGDAGEAAIGAGRFDVGFVSLGNAATSLTLNHNSTGFELGSEFQGVGAIRHLAGETRITGTSQSWGGTTAVTGGSLAVDGQFGSAAHRMIVNGGAILSGQGTIGGAVTVADGTIRPGGDPLTVSTGGDSKRSSRAAPLRGDAIGTLTFTNSLSLGAGSRLAFQLGAPTGIAGTDSDLINIAGNLTLDGTVDVTDAGGFGIGLYRLINYGGTLTNNLLDIGATPTGFAATDLVVQTSVAQQVNLIVGAPPPAFSSFSFWDGDNATGNRAVDGGTGTWTKTARNWTVSTGEANGVYDPAQFLIFAGSGGVATVDTGAGAITIDRGLQFAVGGYRVEGGALSLGTNAITLRVGDGTAAGAGIAATIASDLTGGASIEKTDLGTLILTGTAAPTEGTTITGGTLQIGAGDTGGAIFGNIANSGALVFNREGALAYDGVVSGTGSLEQRGPGTLSLSGVQSYTGLTTVSAGTLTNTGTIVGATNVLAGGTLTNAGTLAAVSNAGTGTNTGTMGALTNTAGSFVNDGTLNGTVANGEGATFATTATLNGNLINEGTARIGGGVIGALDNRGTVTAIAATTGIGALSQTAGATLDLAGFALTAGSLAGDGAVQLGSGTLTTGSSNASTTFAGAISGSGRVVLDGTGQLTVTGANSYTGGTTVIAGTLVGNSQSLQGAIVNEGRVRFDQTAAGTYAGALSGAGLLEKSGAGRLGFTGTGLFSGSTLVSGGELAIDGSLARSIVTIGSGARLGGSGTVGGIVAQSGASVAPGTSVGALSVEGNVALAAGSTFAVDVQGATADRITATGTAQLAGTLAITAVGGPYTFNTPYVLLSAAGGRTGTFDATTGLAGFGPGIRPTVSYDATTVTLRLDPNALGPILAGTALTPNQRSAQVRFDAAIAGGSTSPVPFFGIFNLPIGQFPGALDALSGETHATSARLALDDERMVRKATLDQLRDLDGTPGSSVWGAALGTWGTIARDGNAARVTRDTTGLVTGIDTGGTFGGDDSGWRIGAQAHILRTTFGIGERASSGSLNRAGAGVYGSLTFGGFGVRAGTTLASVKTRTARSIAATGFADQAASSRTGTAFQAFGEIGYTLGNAGASIEPFAGLAQSQLKIGDIGESGGVAAVTVAARTYGLTLADYGLRGKLRLSADGKGAIGLHGVLGVRHVIGGSALSSDIAFASSPALGFSIATVAQDTISFAPEFGLDGDLGGGVSVNLGYSGVIGSRARDHGVKAKIAVAF